MSGPEADRKIPEEQLRQDEWIVSLLLRLGFQVKDIKKEKEHVGMRSVDVLHASFRIATGASTIVVRVTTRCSSARAIVTVDLTLEGLAWGRGPAPQERLNHSKTPDAEYLIAYYDQIAQVLSALGINIDTYITTGSNYALTSLLKEPAQNSGEL